MKYLIIQSFVGSGTWWSDPENLEELYSKLLIPSVGRYCEKYGYKHAVYRDQYDLIDLVNLKSNSSLGNLYHQYLSALRHRDDDVDYMVFPDADFYITRNARALVQTSCIKGTIWSEDEVKKWGRGRDPKTFKTVYGGIQIIRKEAAINLALYVKSRLLDYVIKDSPITLMPNMCTIGEWMANYDIKPENLSLYYNRILDDIEDRPWTEEDAEAGFWHFVGKNKSEKLAYVLEHIDNL